MRKSQFSEQQIAYILRQAEEGMSVEEMCRKSGISEVTHYNWCKKYGGPMPSEMKRLKQLDAENRRLKKLVAGRPMKPNFPGPVVQGWVQAQEASPSINRWPKTREQVTRIQGRV